MARPVIRTSIGRQPLYTSKKKDKVNAGLNSSHTPIARAVHISNPLARKPN